MVVAIGFCSCIVFHAALLQIIAGSRTQEQSTPASNGTVESDFDRARSPHMNTVNRCDIKPQKSPACYKLPCDDDPQCIIMMLLTTPDKVRVINQTDLEYKPLGFYSVVDGIISGLRLAVEECKHQFYWDPWNCPINTDTILTEKIQRTGTRQVSYVQAISAAAVMHSVTKTCTHRENDLCRCGKISNKDRRYYDAEQNMFMWGGCADNVKFGEGISEQLFETSILKRQPSKMTTLSKLHNEKVGRMAVKKSVRLSCRCHGPTGSCSTKTCWTVMADFRTVGDLLRKKYERSKRVTDLEELVNLNRINLDDVNNSTNSTIPNDKVITKHDLVYLADSPDYCVVNYTVGYPGPSGRECLDGESDANVTPRSTAPSRSCETLCKRCGNEVKKLVYHEMYECDCKELWCCSALCKHCRRKVTKYFCK